MEEVFRNTGSNILGSMSQGAHACLFYHTKEDLAEVIVSYLKAGLENREFCIWILPEDISMKEAKQSLKKSIPELNTYLEKAQLEIISREALNTKNKNPKLQEPLNFWLEKLNQALNRGYSGLKLVQDLFWVKEKEQSNSFLDYKKEIGKITNSTQITALCTYSLEKYSSDEILEIIGAHEFFLVKKEGSWKQLGSIKNQKITIIEKPEKVEEPWYSSCKGFDECIRERTADLMYSNVQLETEIEERKRIEEALKTEHLRLRAIIDAMPITIWIADADGCIIATNGQSEIIWSKPPHKDESMAEYREYRGWWPDTGEQLKVEDWALSRALTKGEIIVGEEVNIQRFDGTFGTVLNNAAPIRNANGKIIGGVTVEQDITYQKKVEEALQRSEEKYRQIVETAQEGIWVINEKDQTVFVNKKLTEMLGYSAEEIMSQSPKGFMSPEFRAEAESRMQEHMQSINHVIDYRFLRKDGSDLWCILSSSPIFDDRGQYAGSMAMITDITERKYAEEELKKSKEKYQTLFNSINEGFAYYKAIYDADGRIDDLLVLEINPAGAKISGVEREAQLGKTWREVWLEVEDYWLEAYRKVDRTGESTHFENFSSITGRWYSVQIDCVQKGQFAVTFRDITEKKQEEHRINRYNSVLEGISQILTNAVQTSTEKDLGNVCLYVALEITESQLGFIGVVEADGLLHDITISNMGWEQCLRYDKTGHLQPPGNFDLEGLYGSVITNGKSFFTNNPSSHPDSTGLPEGPPPINSFLGVPFIFNGKTKGILAVANREEGYSREQQEDLEAIAPAVIQALERKKVEQEREEAQKALNTAYQELEEKVKIRTSELETAYNSLKENERRLSEAQKIAHIGYWDWDVLNDKLHWSEETYCIFGLYPQKFGATYEAFINSIHPEDRAYVDNAIKRALTGAPFGIDFRVVLEEGKERIVHSQGKVLFNNKNMPVIMRGTFQDVTEKKHAEQAFLASVAARKKEIHHRIKNNLQVISSLLDLQAEKFGNKECLENSEILEAFKESQDRVVSMALIHEELHEGGGNEYLNFSQYLEKLIDHLFMTYTLENVEISLNLDLQEDIFFDMDTAVPLGIIVNELVSNSLKYAFSGREKGEIQIRLYREENQSPENEIPGCRDEGYTDEELASSGEKRYTLIVSDNGIGIPETTSLEDSETLGIQLVTILVAQLDGEIELNRDAGTGFIIKIPVIEKA